MKIYRDSSEPIYKQIATQIREKILSGKIKANNTLPSIRKLSQKLKISCITTMKAYELLLSEGYITVEKGKGYYVNAEYKKMIAEQNLHKLEQHLINAIHTAKILGLNANEVCNMMRDFWENNYIP